MKFLRTNVPLKFLFPLIVSHSFRVNRTYINVEGIRLKELINRLQMFMRFNISENVNKQRNMLFVHSDSKI